MVYKRSGNLLGRSVFLLLLLFLTTTNVFAKEGAPSREEHRKSLPVDKLIKHLEDPKRELQLQPEKVIAVLGVKKGETVADVGAGTGFFSFRLAAKVGAEGRVYAVEIEDELLDYISKKKEKTGVANIITVKSSDSDPNLPPASCDKVLLVNTYNFLSDPVSFMAKLRQALKPGGLVAIIDMDAAKVKSKKKIPMASEVIEDMKSIGLKLRESHGFLDKKYFLIFKTSE